MTPPRPKKAGVTRGVFLSIDDGRDGVGQAVLELQCRQAARGVYTGRTMTTGGPDRIFYGFVSDEAWPETEALLKKWGRL